jgi:hypothetical protein
MLREKRKLSKRGRLKFLIDCISMIKKKTNLGIDGFILKINI